MNPHVVFYYVAIGPHCFDECKSSVRSLREIGKHTGDVFAVTDQAPDEETERLGMTLIHRQVEIKHASPLKFKCFELLKDLVFPDATIFYLDTDFLIVAPVDMPAILACCDPDKVNVYGYPNRSQRHRCMAGSLTKRPEILAQRAFCAGLFVVSMSNPAVRPTFEKIFNEYMKTVKGLERKPGDKSDPGHGKEQPIFCFNLLDQQQVSIGLHYFVDEFRAVRKEKREIKKSAVLMHFCGGRSGGFVRNVGRPRVMRRVLRGLIKAKKH